MTSNFSRYRYYHKRVEAVLKFIIPENKKVLFFGSLNGELLSSLKASRPTGVESQPELVDLSKRKYPQIKFLHSNYSTNPEVARFDYIVLNGALGLSQDLMGLLKSLHKNCTPTTRLVICQHNYLWQWILSWAENVGLKRKEGVQNWLSVADVTAYLEASGFDVTRIFRRTVFPLNLMGIGKIINAIAGWLPYIDMLSVDQYLIARPDFRVKSSNKPTSLTICITVRNEKENIENIVKNIPAITKKQEILFVEGHSVDGTREEILRVGKSYPEKNIRLIIQPGKGQGDAIRIGFKKAHGEIVILYEGDGTSDPRDISYFYEAMSTGRFEFIEGSRFVYPLDNKAMPLINNIGNLIFAKWFSFVLGRRVTDVLSGIKAILKKDYDILYERWGFMKLADPFGDFELLYGAARMGLKFGEIPMRYYPRTYGQSKTKVFQHGTYLVKMAIKGYWLFRNG